MENCLEKERLTVFCDTVFNDLNIFATMALHALKCFIFAIISLIIIK